MKYYGIIKCTYAELFNDTGKKLFSLQASDFGNSQEQQAVIVTDNPDGKLIQCSLTEPAAHFISSNSNIDVQQDFYIKSCAVELFQENAPSVETDDSKGNIKIIAIAAAALLAIRGLLK